MYQRLHSAVGAVRSVAHRVTAVRTLGRTTPRQARPFFSFGLSGKEGTGTEAEEVPAATAADIYQACKDVHDELLTPLNAAVLGPLEKGSDQGTPQPLVLVLGNHSSGKSTFINHIAGKSVQETGVAPTDDGFTVIAPAHKDGERDGPALVGDPDLGFAGLRSFGSALINHVTLKQRSGMALEDIMLVDSPGMIDAPVNTGVSGGDFYEAIATNASPRDRGYNFPGVVRWFAERADVILLFFDPDKPGTTGETLAIMTNSLVGLDHKLHIVLNKVDQFKNVHDFARAYGSLCWNLSKVIPRKDLPRIYTMCVPTDNQSASQGVLTAAMADLDSTRAEIVREVQRAPFRRVDNVITRLYNSSRLLDMHARVLEAARSKFAKQRQRWLGIGAATLTLTAAAAGAAGSVGMVELAGAALVAGSLGTGAVWWQGSSALASTVKSLTEGEARGLDELWRAAYFMPLAERDDFVVSLWEQVRPQVLEALRTFGLASVPRTTAGDLEALQRTAEETVPALRRMATRAAQDMASKKTEPEPAKLQASTQDTSGGLE